MTARITPSFSNIMVKAAKDLLDILQKLLDHAPLMPEFRKILYVALVRLCRKSELCPRSFELEGVTDRAGEAQSRGTFGDVYRACYDRSPVCLKAVTVYKENLSDIEFERKKVLTRKFCSAFSREAVVWGQLSHANILPFYGICFLNEELHLVSPLVPKGNVWQFFNEPERLEADRTHLISGVSAGMEYLHQNGVAHGDLKCLNVLVAEPEQALLADFGFSYVTDKNGLQHWNLSSSHQAGGTLVFEAPERVSNGYTERKDEASDVFAFGMLCYEKFFKLLNRILQQMKYCGGTFSGHKLVLCTPTFKILAVDTSYIVIGYYLCQCTSNNCKECYYNHFGLIMLNNREARFSQPKLELYSLYQALQALQMYFIGVRNLIIKVNARYIKGMLQKPNIQPSTSMNQWIMAILMFHFKLVHIKGTFHRPNGLLQCLPQPDNPLVDNSNNSIYEDWIDWLHGFIYQVQLPLPLLCQVSMASHHLPPLVEFPHLHSLATFVSDKDTTP
ncbi:L-type lectin-domain containing receptor kinase IV.3 [Termitomyces sp. J132]|nr:L-type lectin-domain containing receptor kinase IV.3 [Termitomyces sp. J132]